jgi:hypothetical protein
VFRAAPCLLLAAALGAVPLQARADVYRWVDDAGVTHFSTSKEAIPSRYRSGSIAIHEAPEGVTNPSSSHPPPRRAPLPQQPAEAPALKSPPAEPAPAPAPGPSAEPAPPPAEGARAPEAPAAAPPALPPAPIAPAPTPQSDAARPATREPGQHEDPRKDEIADLEGQIERDRETLRQLISTPRWDSAALAADPRVREIAARLPRLQAELSALRNEAAH